MEARIEELENKLANSKRRGETYKAWLQDDLKGIDRSRDQIQSDLHELINGLSPKDSWILFHGFTMLPTSLSIELLHKKLARFADDEI